MLNEEMGGRATPQPPDVASARVVVAGASYLAFVALAMLAIFFYLEAGSPSAFHQPTERAFPKPALQTSPEEDRVKIEFEQRTSLSGYGWVDRSEDLARIPVDEAMRLIAAK